MTGVILSTGICLFLPLGVEIDKTFLEFLFLTFFRFFFFSAYAAEKSSLLCIYLLFAHGGLLI